MFLFEGDEDAILFIWKISSRLTLPGEYLTHVFLLEYLFVILFVAITERFVDSYSLFDKQDRCNHVLSKTLFTSFEKSCNLYREIM